MKILTLKLGRGQTIDLPITDERLNRNHPAVLKDVYVGDLCHCEVKGKYLSCEVLGIVDSSIPGPEILDLEPVNIMHIKSEFDDYVAPQVVEVASAVSSSSSSNTPESRSTSENPGSSCGSLQDVLAELKELKEIVYDLQNSGNLQSELSIRNIQDQFSIRQLKSTLPATLELLVRIDGDYIPVHKVPLEKLHSAYEAEWNNCRLPENLSKYFDLDFCYKSLKEPLLKAFRSRHASEFSTCLATFLFDSKVLQSAFLLALTPKAKNNDRPTSGRKKTLSKDAHDAFALLTNHFSTILMRKSHFSLTAWLMVVRYSFNSSVDRWGTSKHKIKVRDWGFNFTPPFTTKNAFEEQ